MKAFWLHWQLEYEAFKRGNQQLAKYDENMECVCTHVATDHCTVFDTIGETLNINKGLVYSIILGCPRKRKLCACFVPHLLTAEQK